MTRCRKTAIATVATALVIVCFSDQAGVHGYAQLDSKVRAAAEAALANATFASTAQRLTVYDHDGNVAQTLGQPAQYRWPVLSPDSTRIAFIRQDLQTKSQDLYVLERSTGSTVQLTSDPASEGSPVWSPDGRSIAYVSNREGSPSIYRRAVTGTEAAELLYRLNGAATLSDWSPDGRYLAFSVVDTAASEKLGDPLGVRAGLYVLRVDGSDAKPIEVLSAEGLRVMGAKFSPDGRFLAFRSNQAGERDVRPGLSNQLWIVRLNPEGFAAGEPRQVSVQGALGMATWRRDGRELYFFSADRELMSVSVTNGASRFGVPRRMFDVPATTYTFGVSDYPFVGAPDGLGSIGRDGREAVFVSVPESRAASFPRQLTLFDRSGKVVRTLGTPGDYSQPVFSPDGNKVAAYRNRALWVFDVASGRSVHITPGGLAYSVAWSPDGGDVAYASYRNNQSEIYRRPANGSGTEQLIYRHSSLGAFIPLTDWSADGRFVSFNGGNVLWTVSAAAQAAAFQMPPTEFNVFGARMSPNGRFVAYVSDESGTNQIYVRPFDSSSGFPSNSEKWQVSKVGGLGLIQWHRDGAQLYYLAADGNVMAVDVVTASAFAAGSSKPLFRLPDTFPLARTNYPDCSCANAVGCEQGHISRDGERFVFALPVPPRRKEVNVASEVLARYAGTYTLAGADVVLTVEGDHLIFDRAGQKSRLFAESETRFFLKTTNGDFEFFRDDNNKVEYFLFYTGGAPRLALKK